MEPSCGCENATIIKSLPISHLTAPFTSSISFPIQTFNPSEKEGDRDIEAMTQCTFFELISQNESGPFILALIRDSSGGFAAYDALSLKAWVSKKAINPLSQNLITHSSLYKIHSILGSCDFLGSSESVQVILSLDDKEATSKTVEEVAQSGQYEECGEEEIVKELDISHLTRPFSSKMRFSILRYDSATKKQELTIEALTKRSFLDLIATRESSSLSFVLALVEDSQGKFVAYDASSFHASVDPISFLSPLKRRIERISWYKIDRLADEFVFLGDSTETKAQFIDLFIRANRGDPDACYELGCLYEKGEVIAKDLIRADHFFALSVAGGSVKAFLRTLGELLNERRISLVLEFFNKVKIQEAVKIGVYYIDLFYRELIPLKTIRYQLLIAVPGYQDDYRMAYLLGKCFKEGLGVPHSREKAAHLFQKAATSCVKARYELGLLAMESKNFVRAKKYFSEAGEAHVPSQLLLAKLLHSSDNNSKGAVKILNRLCEQKIKEAYLPAAEMYLEGKGIPSNYSRAYELLKKASEFDVTACYLLADELIRKEDNKLLFKPEEGFRLVEKAMKMAPNDGRFYWLQFCCYRNGLGVDKSEIMAITALAEGAKLKDERCAESLGEAFYYAKYGCKTDLKQAIEHLEIAENRVDAQLLLAKIYSESQDPVCWKKAVLIYQTLHARGIPSASYRLHIIYRDGITGEKKNPAKARDYLNALYYSDSASYYLQVAGYHLSHFPEPTGFSYSLSKAAETLRNCFKTGTDVQDLHNRVSALIQKKLNGRENVTDFMWVLALVPLVYAKMPASFAGEGDKKLQDVLFDEYADLIESYFDQIFGSDAVTSVFELTKFFEGRYSSHVAHSYLKTLHFRQHPVFYLYKFCADVHHPEAAFLMAEHYRLGTVCAQSDSAAVQYYEIASEQGHLKAKEILGLAFLMEDLGLEFNPAISINCFRSVHEATPEYLDKLFEDYEAKRWENPSDLGFFRLGIYYETFFKSSHKGLFYFEEGAKEGFLMCSFYLASYLGGIEKTPLTERVHSYLQRAFSGEYAGTAIKGEYFLGLEAAAYFFYGKALVEGVLLEKNLPSGVDYLQRATEYECAVSVSARDLLASLERKQELHFS